LPISWSLRIHPSLGLNEGHFTQFSSHTADLHKVLAATRTPQVAGQSKGNISGYLWQPLRLLQPKPVHARQARKLAGVRKGCRLACVRVHVSPQTQQSEALSAGRSEGVQVGCQSPLSLRPNCYNRFNEACCLCCRVRRARADI
jgi:hypothetical protein